MNVAHATKVTPPSTVDLPTDLRFSLFQLASQSEPLGINTIGHTLAALLSIRYCSKTQGGAGRERGDTQNADRGRATPHSGTNPHTGQNRGQDTPGSDQEQNGRDNTAQKQPRDPTNRRKNHKQPAPRPPGGRPDRANSAEKAGTHAASATSAPTKHPSLLLPHRR